MVIYDLNILCACSFPIKTDAPLIVDTNAVLAGTIAFECFDSISGWYSQIIQPVGNLDLSQLPSCHIFDIHKPPYADSLCKGFSVGTFERSDHVSDSNALRD